MRRPILTIAAILFLLPMLGWAQTHQPYAGLETRPIKALSDQQIADLKAGRGMGFALAAELNGYPGPSHVLELADQLGLSEAQRSAVQTLFESMKAEAVPIGQRLIDQEAALDSLFADHKITVENLAVATAEIGDTQAKLRDTHLKYHLSTVALLESRQIQHYGELRGYAHGTQQHHRP
jgi:hypothetical protein